MKETLVTFETAKLAKERGFKLGFCRELFYPNPNKKGEYVTTEMIHDWELTEDRDWYSRPTQALLQKWLREQHKYHFHIYYGIKRKWCIDVYYMDVEEDYAAGLQNKPNEFMSFETYEDALEAGLQFALKLIKL